MTLKNKIGAAMVLGLPTGILALLLVGIEPPVIPLPDIWILTLVFAWFTIGMSLVASRD